MAKPPTDLTTIDPAELHTLTHLAAMRLQLFVTGKVHALIQKYTDAALAYLAPLPKDQPLTATQGSKLSAILAREHDQFLTAYTRLVYQSISQAAALPWATWAILHEKYIVDLAPVAQPPAESRQTAASGFRRAGGMMMPITAGKPVSGHPEQPSGLTEAAPISPTVVTSLYQDMIDRVAARKLADGLQLSGRIWRLDKSTRNTLAAIVTNSVADGKSAWDTAGGLEDYLAPGRQCPRWTYTRLGTLTKTDIAQGDRRGLLSGADCDGRGVSYNALRLIRNETQTALNMATDQMIAQMPYLEGEKINLSPDHPEPDICDEVATGGDKSDGVYQPLTIVLPLHVQCLCWKELVTIDIDKFSRQLGAWANGAKDAPIQRYAGNFPDGDGSPGIWGSMLAIPAAYALYSWLTNSPEEMENTIELDYTDAELYTL